MYPEDPPVDYPEDTYPEPNMPHDASQAGHAIAKETNQWAMMLHLSQFAGFVVPVAGFIAPVLIWQLKKDDLPGLDIHGRMVTNWLLSGLVYVVIMILLCLTIVLIPIVWLGAMFLSIAGVAFPIFGAIKASDGVTWKYPGTIRFF